MSGTRSSGAGFAVALVLLIGSCADPETQAPPAAPVEASTPAAPAPSPTVADVPTSSPATPTTAPSGEVIYRAEWSSGLDGWTTNEDWAVSEAELLCRGQMNQHDAGAVAPVEVDALDGFAVEAEVKVIRYEISNGSFGVMVRVQDDGDGYILGHEAADDEAVLHTVRGGPGSVIDARPFRAGTDWHRYRIEVRGNTLAAFIDGAPVLSATDNTHLSGRVGLSCRGAQLSVRSFEVSDLGAS